MTCKGSTGLGVTMSLQPSVATGKIRSLALPSWLLESVDFTGLADTGWFCSLPGGPTDPGVISGELFLDTALNVIQLGEIYVATITIPPQAGGAPATLVASGFFTEWGFGGAAINEPMLNPFAFRLDGNSSKPAWSPEAGGQALGAKKVA